MTPEKYNELIQLSHDAALANGWWDDLPSDPETRAEWLSDKIDLIAGEGAEAVEALRNGRRVSVSNKPLERGNFFPDIEKPLGIRVELFKAIKDTFEDEIADIAIRTMDLMGFYEWEWALELTNKLAEVKQLEDSKYIIRSIRYNALYGSLLLGIFSNNKTMFILSACERIAEIEGFDLEWHIRAKLAYNATRGKKHGKKF